MKTKLHAGSDVIKKLRLIQQFFAGTTIKAVLAGGALRDDYMGKSNEISDYDIFVNDITPFLTAKRISLETAMGLLATQVFPGHADAVQLFGSDYLTLEEQYNQKSDVKPGSHAQIKSVWEVDEHDCAYQIVFTANDPVVHIEKYFDIGFCKAYYDGQKIRYTGDFLRDVKNKTMTIVGEDMTKEQVEYAIYHHAEKLMWKYDGFRVVVPERYQEFVEDHGFPTF